MTIDDLLEYEPSTGVIRWRVQRGRQPAGSLAGSPHPHGYIAVRVLGQRCLAHRLAWRLYYGEWPARGVQIDHIDRDKRNNRIGNLRLATPSQNSCNAKQKQPKSGVRGVTFHTQTNSWNARVWVGNRLAYSRYFKSVEAAAAAVTAARSHLHGEFARHD